MVDICNLIFFLEFTAHLLKDPSEVKRINDFFKEAFIDEMRANKRDKAFIVKVTQVLRHKI